MHRADQRLESHNNNNMRDYLCAMHDYLCAMLSIGGAPRVKIFSAAGIGAGGAGAASGGAGTGAGVGAGAGAGADREPTGALAAGCGGAAAWDSLQHSLTS
jgi:hypothetical protein